MFVIFGKFYNHVICIPFEAFRWQEGQEESTDSEPRVCHPEPCRYRQLRRHGVRGRPNGSSEFRNFSGPLVADTSLHRRLLDPTDDCSPVSFIKRPPSIALIRYVAKSHATSSPSIDFLRREEKICAVWCSTSTYFSSLYFFPSSPQSVDHFLNYETPSGKPLMSRIFAGHQLISQYFHRDGTQRHRC